MNTLTDKIVRNWETLSELLKVERDKGKKVAFTNGCFDIIHAGHVSYLKKIKDFSDILVVGVNSDSSIKNIKGDSRPIILEEDRIQILAAFYFVDYVTIFNEGTPLNLIKKILPDILVKGGDWNIDNIVGKDIVENSGGIVKTVNYINGLSTTGIIEKIIKNYKKGD